MDERGNCSLFYATLPQSTDLKRQTAYLIGTAKGLRGPC